MSGSPSWWSHWVWQKDLRLMLVCFWLWFCVFCRRFRLYTCPPPDPREKMSMVPHRLVVLGALATVALATDYACYTGSSLYERCVCARAAGGGGSRCLHPLPSVEGAISLRSKPTPAPRLVLTAGGGSSSREARGAVACRKFLNAGAHANARFHLSFACCAAAAAAAPMNRQGPKGVQP